MGILKSISKSMKGTFIGDMAKSADKAIDATGSFISDCIDETICGIADGADCTPIRDKIAISCMLRQIHEFSSHAIRHGLYIKNRKRLFCP